MKPNDVKCFRVTLTIQGDLEVLAFTKEQAKKAAGKLLSLQPADKGEFLLAQGWVLQDLSLNSSSKAKVLKVQEIQQ